MIKTGVALFIRCVEVAHLNKWILVDRAVIIKMFILCATMGENRNEVSAIQFQ